MIAPVFFLLCVAFHSDHAASIPADWKSYIAPEMLAKYSGQRGTMYSETLFQGDIDGVEKDVIGTGAGLNNAINDAEKRWPNGTVPYEYSDIFNGENRELERQIIELAMAQIASATGDCVKFVRRTNQSDYIRFVRGLSCSSSVGRDGGRQDVSLARGCMREIGSVQHELMHALGFYHENARADRDKYILINWDNLDSKFKKDFEIHTDALTFGLSYDYESVLHYAWNAFAIDSDMWTILPKKKRARIGQSAGLSVLDMLKLRKAYSCTEFNSEKGDELTEPGTAQRPQPTQKLDFRMPDFKQGYLTKERCRSIATENCGVGSAANCPAGEFTFYCAAPVSANEVNNQLRNIHLAIPDSPFTFFVETGNSIIPTLDFGNLAVNLVSLIIQLTVNFDCALLTSLPLPNLLLLAFRDSRGVVISRGSLKPFHKLRILEMWNSTIALMEKDIFDNLISLKSFILDGYIFTAGMSPSRAQYDHLYRFHCSAGYAWFREYVAAHPTLIEPKKEGEVFDLVGTRNTPIDRRRIYYPVDCSRGDLTGLEYQFEFALHPEK